MTNGISFGAKNQKGKMEDELSVGEAKGIPTVKMALRTSKMTKGIGFISKIKSTILSPFQLTFKVKPSVLPTSNTIGKRVEAITTLHRGRPLGWKIPKGKPRDIHLPATIRTAAAKKKFRATPPEKALEVFIEDIREKLRLYKAPMTMVFVLDLSGSMMLSIEAAKEALLKLHRDAYRYRDKVGIVALKETQSEVVQHPITNLGVVANKLLSLKISGFTPLASGMLKALEVLKSANRRDKTAIPVMVIITDGNANVPLYKSLETGEIRSFDEASIAFRAFEDLAVKDAFAVSRLIKKAKINTIIINTNQRLYGKEAYGSIVTELISKITKGYYYRVDRLSVGTELFEDIFTGISDGQNQVTQMVLFKK
ncbi:VWA domain-containing protein [Candidatus Hodarchaeum mangrovi]